MMLKFIFVSVMLWHCLLCLRADDNLNNLNTNLTDINHDLWPKNVSYAQEHKSTVNEAKDAQADKLIKPQEMSDLLDPVANAPSSANNNRTGRQLFYSPSFFYIQNLGAEATKCVTSRGLVGLCMSFDSCMQTQRYKRHLALYNGAPWDQTQQLVEPAVQQQQEFCQYYDQYLRSSYGVCCTNLEPVMTGPAYDKPAMDMPKPGPQSNFDDSEVLEADLSSYEPEPPKYDTNDNQNGNNIDYDPIENLKQASFGNNYNNYIRYPWPQQFIGFSGVQQWPPPVPTHPPSIASWPPPIPTHPPNHHYPTHPPLAGGGGFQYTTTTRRPTYRPTYYPTQRPLPTSSPTLATTTTTTRKPVLVDTAAMGLPLQCGLRNAVSPDQERIVGGTNASPHEFPWIAVLFKSGKQFCGGSLITNNHILTAAHCVARMTSWDVAALTAHLGDYNIRTDFEVKHVSRRIKRLVRHKGFDFSTLHNDIAILTLNEPVQFTTEISPICLPTSAAQQSRTYSGHTATVAGWGSLRENGPQPAILQKVQIPIWTNAECAQKYGRAAPAGIIDSMICAGQAAKDSCSGDSGGPMIVNDGARYIQVGIVSWGIGCGKGQYPGVYTRVTSLLPWIYKNIK